MAAPRSPVGSPPPPFFNCVQKSVWSSARRRCCERRRECSPGWSRGSSKNPQAIGLKIGVAIEGLIQVGDISPMVFVVMNFHGSGMDVVFEIVEWVQQRGHGECHGLFLQFEISINIQRGAGAKKQRCPLQAIPHRQSRNKPGIPAMHGVLLREEAGQPADCIILLFNEGPNGGFWVPLLK